MFDSRCDIDSLGAVCIDAVRPSSRKTKYNKHESGRVKQQYVEEERSKRIFIVKRLKCSAFLPLALFKLPVQLSRCTNSTLSTARTAEIND